MTIRVLVADDHPMFRFGMRALLEAQPDFEVAGEVDTGPAAVRAAAALVPDVVLMDIAMPGLNGIDATARIKAESPRVAVLVVTMLDDDTVLAAIRAGARGYLMKGADPEETLRAIRAVAAGGSIFSPSAADRLTGYLTAAPAAPQPFPQLTNRERQILCLLAEGLTNSAIAERLSLSPKTVRNYVSEILAKLHVNSRTEAAHLAHRQGLPASRHRSSPTG